MTDRNERTEHDADDRTPDPQREQDQWAQPQDADIPRVDREKEQKTTSRPRGHTEEPDRTL